MPDMSANTLAQLVVSIKVFVLYFFRKLKTIDLKSWNSIQLNFVQFMICMKNGTRLGVKEKNSAISLSWTVISDLSLSLLLTECPIKTKSLQWSTNTIIEPHISNKWDFVCVFECHIVPFIIRSTRTRSRSLFFVVERWANSEHPSKWT